MVFIQYICKLIIDLMRFKIAHQLPARHFCLNNLIFSVPARNGLFNNPHSQPSGFYWSHECSWTLTSANRMQVSNIQSYDHNRKQPGLRQGLKVLCLRSQRWTGGGVIMCQHILVSCFTCTPHGDIV